MTGKSYFFVQSVTINDVLIDKATIESTSYIEHANMNGSLLVMVLADESGTRRDEFKIRAGDKVVATLGDPDDSDTLFQEVFTVLSAPVSGGRMRINAMQAHVNQLKIPVHKPIFITERPTLQSVSILAGGLPVKAGRVNGLCAYHLDVGGNRSGLMRSIALDHASLCYWSRGSLYLMPYSEAFAQKPVLTLESNNPKAKHTISYHRWLDHDLAATLKVAKRYASFSMTEGWQYSDGDPSLPTEFVPNATRAQLNARLKAVVPLLEVETAGFGRLRAGMMVGVRIHKMNRENVLDESAPTRMLITRVTHHETSLNYICTLELGVLRG